jgi:hypothetical protein
MKKLPIASQSAVLDEENSTLHATTHECRLSIVHKLKNSVEIQHSPKRWNDHALSSVLHEQKFEDKRKKCTHA